MLYIIGVPFIDQLLAKITRLLLWIIKRKKYKLPPPEVLDEYELSP